MMISLFLAKALGIYLLIVGFGLIINAKTEKQLLNEIMENPPLLFVTGFIALIVGIAMVVSHNLWVMDWRVVVTLAAWSSLIKGTLLVTFPEKTIALSKKWLKCDAAYFASAVFAILLGAFLSYHGFF